MRFVTLTVVSIVLFALATRTVSALPPGSRYLANDNVDTTNTAAIDGVSSIYKRQEGRMEGEGGDGGSGVVDGSDSGEGGDAPSDGAGGNARGGAGAGGESGDAAGGEE